MFMEYELSLEKAMEHYKTDLSTIRAGRANPHILDKIRVDYYGTLTPLSQMSNIIIQDARLLTITPWDSSMVKEIVKAIMTSDIGINPSDDGRIIRLNFPALTEDRRREIVKSTRKMCEDVKIAGRNIRRDIMDELKKLKKDSSITEDEIVVFEKNVQKNLDKFNLEIDKVFEDKEKEIMQV
ncbi:MAG: ribosome recycling factor [Clostridia bacterium]